MTPSRRTPRRSGLGLAVALAASLFAGPAGGQEGSTEIPATDELLGRVVDARGGIEALRAVSSLRVVGSLGLGAEDRAPVTVEWRRPDRLRIDFAAGGEPGVRAFDGERAWARAPALGIDEPKVLDGFEARRLESQADFLEGPLVEPGSKGHAVDVVGAATFAGRDAWELRVELATGEAVTAFVDRETTLPLGERFAADRGGKEVAVEVRVSDWQEVAGVLLPYRVETRVPSDPEGTPPRVFTVDRYEAGVDLPDERFAPPVDDPSDGSTPD